eukprot:scaffold834_cov123-Cylindrotheca_fusiformis.AAC.47
MLVQARPSDDDSGNRMECLPSDEDASSFACVQVKEELGMPCTNNHPQCEEWAHRNECANNPQYMLLQCSKACNSCISFHHGGTTQVASSAHPQMQTLRSRSVAIVDLEGTDRVFYRSFRLSYPWQIMIPQ